MSSFRPDLREISAFGLERGSDQELLTMIQTRSGLAVNSTARLHIAFVRPRQIDFGTQLACGELRVFLGPDFEHLGGGVCEVDQ
jgi:hypothetical protein